MLYALFEVDLNEFMSFIGLPRAHTHMHTQTHPHTHTSTRRRISNVYTHITAPLHSHTYLAPYWIDHAGSNRPTS